MSIVKQSIKYQPKTKLEMILAELYFTNILNFLYYESVMRDPKGKNPICISGDRTIQEY